MANDQIPGLPPGAIVDDQPYTAPQAQPVKGLPPGAIVDDKPYVPPQAQAVKGLPPGAVVDAQPYDVERGGRDASGVLHAPAGGTTISARKSSFWGSLADQSNWWQDVQGDVKNGSATTWVGAALKRLGAKGLESDAEGQHAGMIGDVLSGPLQGVPKVEEGITDIARQVGEGVTSSNLDPHKMAIAANKVVGGAFQSAAPLAVLAGAVEAPVVGTAIAAQNIGTKLAIKMGIDPDYAELIGNVFSLGAAHKINASMHPVAERFGVATDELSAASQEYNNRARNLEVARGQAENAHNNAIDAADRETRAAAEAASGQKPETIGSKAETDRARQTANEAAKNVADAQKALNEASERRADATIQLEKLHRQIKNDAIKEDNKKEEAKKSDQDKARDLFQKAVPSKGSTKYSPDDLEVFLAHAEEAKANGAKLTDLSTAYEAADNARQGLQDDLEKASEPIKDAPVISDASKTESPKVVVEKKLDEMAKVDGNFANAMSAITGDRGLNVTDPTVSEAFDTITKLNNYNRAAMKGANNWDIYNMIETNPSFAARYFMAEALREAVHAKLESAGIENSKAARSEMKSLINVRDAIGAQERANRGGVAIRGSGTSNKMRLLVADLTGRGIRGAAIAGGAELAGPVGAVGADVVSGPFAQAVKDLIAPRDMTRNEHIEKAFKLKTTDRQPVKVKGVAKTEGYPTEPIPPAPSPTAPEPLALTPREDTKLHAALIANSTDANAENLSYQDLEDDFRKDIVQAKKSGKKFEDLTSAQQKIYTQILEADAADRAIRKAANEAVGPNKTATAGTAGVEKPPEQKLKEDQKRAADVAAGNRPVELNPVLVALGRGDESGLVSHTVARKANTPAAEVTGLQKGLTSLDAHREEWAHVAVDRLIGGPDSPPLATEIWSDQHEDMDDNAAAAIFDAQARRESYTNPDGTIDEEKFKDSLDRFVVRNMAGPATREVFNGWSKEDALKSWGNGSDITNAREAVNKAYPDWTPQQVNEYLDHAYEQAREILTLPHVADRINANALVREDGLPKELHASRERVSNFQKGIMEAHDEYTGKGSTEPSPSGAGKGRNKAKKPTAEAGEKEKPGGNKVGQGQELPRGNGENGGVEGGKELGGEEKSQLRNIPVPKETSTGNAEMDAAIKEGGAIPAGRFGPLAMFHHPDTGTTLAMKPEEITPESVKEHVAKSTESYTQGDIRNAARKYNLSRGLPEVNPAPVLEDPRVQEMGRVYDELKHDPTNPKVKASYDAFKNELDHQYDMLEKEGFKFDTSKEDPYKSYEDMRQDILRNKHLTAWEGAAPPEGHPLAEIDPKTGFSYNEKFRLVHDVLGHAAHDADFSGHGEESAWNYHRQMFSPEAQNALAGETRGQVASYTRNGAFPETQKAVLMPDEFTKRPEELGGKVEKSNLTKDEHNEVLEGIKRSYGVHDDPKLANHAGFITPDGRHIDLPSGVDHTDAIESHGGEPAINYEGDKPVAADNRKNFINETGTIRVSKGRNRAGDTLTFSVPKDGVTPKQADAMTKSFAANGSRTGSLGIERADISPETKNTLAQYKDFPRPADVKSLLQKIDALKTEQSNLKKDWTDDVTTKPFGGVNPNDPASPSKKYAFELAPEYRHTPSELTADEARAYAERPDVKAALATHPDIKLGWDTTTGGRPELNVGVSTDDLDTAKKVAGKLDQRAIVDTTTGDEIPAGGEGKRTEFLEYPLADRLKDLGIEQSNLAKSPKGSTVPLMTGQQAVPEIKGTGNKGTLNTFDVANALNDLSQKSNPALELKDENQKAMVARAAKLGEDEAKYQLTQGKTGKEWYTEEMKDHDATAQQMRPELTGGEMLNPTAKNPELAQHPVKLSLFKASEGILSSGQKPYANFKSNVKSWDYYNENGKFSPYNPNSEVTVPADEATPDLKTKAKMALKGRTDLQVGDKLNVPNGGSQQIVAVNPDGSYLTAKSWGPRGLKAYGNAFNSLNSLIADKGEKGAADWLMSDHTVKELKQYNKGVEGKADDMVPGAMILGAKRGPFMQNLHGVESAFTADMWVSRTWNRWMGTIEVGKDEDGEDEIKTDSPRNETERGLMKQSFEHVANKLNLSTSSLQAVLWYYEQSLYGKMGIPKESWSFRDAAKRVQDEEAAGKKEQESFNFGQNEGKAEPATAGVPQIKAKKGNISAADLVRMLKGE